MEILAVVFRTRAVDLRPERQVAQGDFILVLFQNDREPDVKNRRFWTSRRSVDMITNDVQYRATQAHLEQFERALANLAAKSGNPTRLDQLEFDAVSAKASDLRAEIDEYERVREA